MERLFDLGSKELMSGISPSAHTEQGGLFLKAKGVTAAYDPAGSESTQNGLLQACGAITDHTGSVVVDTPIASVVYDGGTPYLLILGDGGHFYRKPYGSGAPVDIRSGTPYTNPANGVAKFQPRGGTLNYYVWQRTQIGVANPLVAYPTGWTDDTYTGLQDTYLHPTHAFLDAVYYGNKDRIGALLDAGDTTVNHQTNVLDINTNWYVTGLCDDGVYLVAATSNNLAGVEYLTDNKIIFWDTYSSSWQREWKIYDPAIWAIKSVGSNIYAFGQFGIYECSFNSPPRKVLNAGTGFSDLAYYGLGYGSNRAGVFNQSALMWGGADTLNSIGKLASDLPSAYLRPFYETLGEVSWIETQFEKGKVYFGTRSDKLAAAEFNFATRQTSLSAETVYIPLKKRGVLNRIDVYFGEPLASGDSLNIDVQADEDVAAVDWNTASFAVHGAKRFVPLHKVGGGSYETEQIKLVLNFNGGAVKIKRIVGWGEPLEP